MYNALRLRPLATAVALVAVATACQSKSLPDNAADAPPPAPAAITPEQIDLGQRQYLELVRMQLIDDRCHWLDATSRVAVNATAAERQAWLADRASSQAVDEAAKAANTQQADATDCDNANDAFAVRFGAWQMRITWTLRAQAMLDGEKRPAWFSTQSPTLEFRPALNETLAALNAKYGASITQSQPGIEQQAIQMLALACPKQPSNCPTLAATGHSKAYAQAWVEQATRYAAALAKDPVKLPEPPQES